MPRTLIAIPAYNCERTVGMTLESCARQTAPVDVLVVDNHSTDGTRETVERAAADRGNVELIANDANLGRVGNWNRCLDLFREREHEFFKPLFAGDTLKPECIERAEWAADQAADIGAVFWPYEFRDGDSVQVYRHYDTSRHLPAREINVLNIAEGGRLGAIVCNLYTRSGVADHRFNEGFIGKADFDYRVLQEHGAYHLNEVLSTFHVEHHGTFKSALNNYCVNIEASLARCCALERSKAGLSPAAYKNYREKIIADTFCENMRFLGARALLATAGATLVEALRRLTTLRLGALRRAGPRTTNDEPGAAARGAT